MATAVEAAASRTPIGSDLKAGIDAISINQTVTFTLYVQVILPFDGYVFWVKADQLSSSALQNTSLLNAFQLNQVSSVATAAPTLTAMGSLHYESDQRQDEDATYVVNRVTFTSEVPIQDFNAVGPKLMYIGTFDGVRFAFNNRASFYRQTSVWHYSGNAIYSTMDSQIIDNPSLLNTNRLISTNSLPAWLALNNYAPAWHVDLPFPRIPLYPSFLSPSNWVPPYITVHVEPSSTRSLQMVPFLNSTLSHYQLTSDTVTLTLWGCDNDLATTIYDAILQYTLDTGAFGIMGMPVIRDDRPIQTELQIIGQKKRIVFEVSYNQASVRAIVRQLILSAFVTYIPTTD